MKIAILTCLNTSKKCSGLGCMRNFNNRTKKYEIYQNKDVQLSAFSHCNGCDSKLSEDEGLQKKLNRWIEEKVEVVHLTSCTKKDGERCGHVKDICEFLQAKDVKIVE